MSTGRTGEGIKAGIFFATACSMIAGAIYVLAGSDEFSKVGVSLPVVILCYYFGAVAGGMIYGHLYRYAVGRVRAWLVGIAVMAPVCLSISVSMFGSPVHWDRASWFAAVIGILFFGALAGDESWSREDG